MFNWAFKKVVKFREKVAVDLGDADVEKPFLDHLEDLRTMIVRMAVTLLVVTIGTFCFCDQLLAIIQHPLTLAGIRDKIELQNFKVTGGFMTAMNVSLVAGVVLAFPVLLYFLLQFVLPGLRSNEKKVVFPALAVGAGLFIIGVVFSYYLVAPRALQFFYEFSVSIGGGGASAQKEEMGLGKRFTNDLAIVWESRNPQLRHTVETSADGKTWSVLADSAPEGKPDSAKEVRFVRITALPLGVAAPTVASAATAVATINRPFIWELTEYVKFVCQFVLIFGACFELPVVVMALVKLDVLSYQVMKGTRSWAAVIIAIVAAVITPTQDMLTLALLAVPMYVLYEICIWLAWWMEKRDRKLYPEYYKDLDNETKDLEVADDWDNENYNPWNSDERDEDEDGSPSPSSSASASSPRASGDSSATSEPVEGPGTDADKQPPEQQEQRNTD